MPTTLDSPTGPFDRPISDIGWPRLTSQSKLNSPWLANSSPIFKATNNAIEYVSKPLVRSVTGSLSTGAWGPKIDRLNSKGDSARSGLSLDGEIDVSAYNLVPGAGKMWAQMAKKYGLGIDGAAKAQSSHIINVERDSSAPDSTYTVRTTKTMQAGLGAEIGVAPNLSANGSIFGPHSLPNDKHRFGLFPSPSVFARGDAYVGTSNTVEMRFPTKQDAQRAAEKLEQLGAADVVDDAMRTGLLAQKLPPFYYLPNVASTIEGSGNNLANPMSEHGEVNPGLRRAAGVTDADMKLLSEHIVAQEFSVMRGSRSAGEGRAMVHGQWTLPGGAQLPNGGKIKSPALDPKVGKAVVPNLWHNASITRRIEYPTATAEGRIVDRFGGYSQMSVKERDVQSLNVTLPRTGIDTLSGMHRHDDNYDLQIASTTVEYAQPVAAGTQVDLNYLAKQAPKLDQNAVVKSSVLTPTAAEKAGLGKTFNPFGGSYGAAPGGQQRLDMNRTYLEYNTSGMDGMKIAGTMSIAGGHSGTLWQGSRQGKFVDQRQDVVQRDGYFTTETGRLGVPDVIAGELSLSKYSGVDDLPKPPDCPTTPDPVNPKPPPAPNAPTHWQVQPYSGVNVRSSPTTQADNQLGVVQSGSFLDGNGATSVDADGHTWIQVKGTDENDHPINGWARVDNLKPFDKAVGDNDALGRVNPQREQSKQAKRIVEHDDNLWHLAQLYGEDFDQLLAANAHLLDPNLVFAGDSVYLPSH